jgi:cysteine-rich repeat protein
LKFNQVFQFCYVKFNQLFRREIRLDSLDKKRFSAKKFSLHFKILKGNLGDYELLMGDSRIVIPVIVGILIIGLLFTVNFEQNAYSEMESTVLNEGLYPNYNIVSVSFTDVNNGIAVGYSFYDRIGLVLRTTDGGATWTTVYSKAEQRLYAVDFADANTGLVVGASGLILRTTDGGATWATSSYSVADLKSVDFIDANTAFITGSLGVVAKSSNGGVGWTLISYASGATIHSGDFIDANTGIVVSDYGHIRMTTDSGRTWTGLDIGTLQHIQGIEFIDANNMYASVEGRFYQSADGGSTWTTFWPGTSAYGVDFIDANNGIVVGAPGLIGKTTDGGATWTTLTYDSTNYLFSVDFIDANNAIAVGGDGLVVRLSGTSADNDSDGFTSDLDCDDDNPAINPGATEILDNGIDEDCDGVDATSPDTDSDGFSLADGDCDDSNPNIYPGAFDIPGNSIDEDCDGFDAINLDTDSDGYTTDGTGLGLDCDDTNPAINPGATEILDNGIDEDCDGKDLVTTKGGDADGDGIPDSSDNCKEVSNKDQTDSDKDGVGDACDSTPKGGTELPTSEEPTQDPESISTQEPAQTDTDSDGIPDSSDNCIKVSNKDQTDSDNDGIGDVCDSTPKGDTTQTETAITQEPVCGDGVVDLELAEECDDGNLVNGDGCSNQCTNEQPTQEPTQDADSDGFSSISSGGLDCDDANPSVYPGAYDIPGDGIDQDCDGVDATSSDADGDGIPDSSDNCIKVSNKDQADYDHDGIGDVCDSTPKGDTASTETTQEPTTEEPTKETTEEQIAEPTQETTQEPTTEQTVEPTQESTLDADGDGYTTDGSGSGLDCDDTNPAINPGAKDISGNGIDENCDGKDSKGKPSKDGTTSTDTETTSTDTETTSTDTETTSTDTEKTRGPKGGGVKQQSIDPFVMSESESKFNIMESGKSYSTYGKQGYSYSFKAIGTFLTSTNSENVCGLSLCSEKLSMQQKIDLYLKTLGLK